MSSSSRSPKPRRRLLAIGTALAVLMVATWLSPPVPRWSKGPSALEVELATEKARGQDLSRQVAELSEQARKGHPLTTDNIQRARADDLAAQNDAFEADDARPRPTVPDRVLLARIADLKRQDAEHVAALRRGQPPVIDPSAAARAEDLAAQNDRLEAQLMRPRPTLIPPVVATLTKADIVAGSKLFGLYTAQSPFDYSEIDLVQTAINRRANIIGYFQSWQDPFRSDAIEATWRHGQIPLLTWEPQTRVGVISADDPAFSLPVILSGRYDDYIRSYAAGIRALGLPVIIRLAHEMNGTWYPWSEVTGWNGEPVNGNRRGDFAAMWRHVHDLFQEAGANDYAIWLWSPNRVNQIPSQPDPVEYYPGDDVVDWIGMSGYYRPHDDAPTFADTFGPTLPLLRAAGNKPIFLSEIGATEVGGRKANWVKDLYASLPANPDIIGFAWFNLTVTSTIDGERQTNDWRINSSGGAAQAMREGLTVTGFGL